jgi:dolichyl-phosphate-mannose-protein mannosyltransferase
LIPRHHIDGKVSSNGQQVNAYGHSDMNSIWEILTVDNEKYPDSYKPTEEENERQLRYVRANSNFRLRHVATGNYLATHDVASPLTKTNMEVTAWNETAADLKYNNTIWFFGYDQSKVSNRKIKSKRDYISIINRKYNVALKTDKDSILPDWGFKMLEVNGNKNLDETNNNHWKVVNVTHPSIIEGKYILIKAKKKTANQVEINHYHLLQSLLNCRPE